jgi:hypothetical protein
MKPITRSKVSSKLFSEFKLIKAYFEEKISSFVRTVEQKLNT